MTAASGADPSSVGCLQTMGTEADTVVTEPGAAAVVS